MGSDKGSSLVFCKINVVVIEFLGFPLGLVRLGQKLAVFFYEKMPSKAKEALLGFVGGLPSKV